MLETAGFDVVDLGIDVSPEAFVEAIRKYQPHIVGMSALLTTTMGMMQKTIQAMIEAGVRDRLRVIVGGAPVTAEFTERIGADGYGIDAVAAAELATSLVGT
jgi:5-methyltetrahydrofolate--homocysteine methyltransferase